LVVVKLAGTDVRGGLSRGLLIAIGLACSCGDATHTVGLTAAEQKQQPQAGNNSVAEAARGAAGVSGTPGPSVLPGDVGVADGGLGPTEMQPDPIAMIGQPAFSCGGTATPAVRRRLDLFLMVDINLFYVVGTLVTMPTDSTWVEIQRGLREYVDDPRAAGTGVGVGYFPAPVSVPGSGPVCDPDKYSMPAAEVKLLPENAAAIRRSIPLAPLGLGSPTLPALQGALNYARSRWRSWPYKQAVVLVTDKVADFACVTNPAAIVDAAREAAAIDPPIPTYVIALSATLDDVLLPFVRPEALDAVAAEGGTGAARQVDLEDRNSSLARTLHDIQVDAEPCQYEVSVAVRADPTGSALGTVAASGSPLPLPRLDSVADCGQGYYFDDPANPEWATLCADTCTALKASPRTVAWIDECQML
jgi:hypothetical protein